MSKTALLVGATGLVGSNLLSLLISDNNFSKIIILSRKSLSIHNDKIEEFIVDFDQLDNILTNKKIDFTYCCLGTTIKQAGSKEVFRKVDYEFPLTVAKISKANGVKSYNIITALGSNANSSIFYNKVKGEIQEALIKLNFEQLNFFQPSLLLGDRNEKRTSEDIGQKIAPIFNKLLIGGLKKYQAIEGKQVAKAMLQYSLLQQKGINYFTNDLLLKA